MPYIKKLFRYDFDEVLNKLPYLTDKGELEYCLFVIMKRYMSNREYRYSNLHDCVYSAQHCADEFRRRYLDSREDQAIIENGDIR